MFLWGEGYRLLLGDDSEPINDWGGRFLKRFLDMCGESGTVHYTNGYVDYERCNAKRVVQYPLGMVLDSDPKPVPRYCVGKEYL